jgi:hypothetical protein
MADDIKKNRYKHADGKRLIEVRVKSALQLFDARDPAPFRERDLDEDFLEYITASAREFPTSRDCKIVIHIDELEGNQLTDASIKESIQSYLSYKIDLKKSDLKTFLKRAQIFLGIGLLVLASCIGIAQSLKIPNPPGAIGILREGVVIFGWVSIWKPIELILFDWYPLFEKIRLYKKLMSSEVEIKFGQAK